MTASQHDSPLAVRGDSPASADDLPATTIIEALPPQKVYHCIKGNPLEIWRKCATALGPSCKEGRELLGMVFPLHCYLLKQAQFTDRDGEVIDIVRTVLISPTGDAYGFSSQGVLDSLAVLIGIVGEGPYDPPIPITVLETQTRSGGRLFQIEPAPTRFEAKKP